MAKNLVIVESPAKAKTIEGYLGNEFKVASSYGHVRDLPKDDMAIDIANGFNPTYEISNDKKDIIKQLKKLAKEAENIFLASDDDREGEAISWHLKETLDLKDQNTKRIVFHEITKKAIQQALSNPRTIDLDLVNAQQARRILDRLVGFELSPVLWKKVRKGLSAGRVQSVAVRLVVDREREIDKHQSTSNYRVTALFSLPEGKTLSAELNDRFNTLEEARAFLDSCKGAAYQIDKLEKKPVKKSPAAPFTTSTLQQEASRKLGYSVSRTMSLAQRLYESGKISYMRTDSTSLSEEAQQNASAVIRSEWGDKYSHTRQYKTKSQSAQEAHEAIRPTDFSQQVASSDNAEQRLYELIWKRAIASQMADAQLERTNVRIAIQTAAGKTLASANSAGSYFTATGEVVKFDGFLKVYIESTDEEAEDGEQKGVLPPLNEGQMLSSRHLKARETFSRPPARYTEASLVKKLEEMGIGRPSTYAPTISTIQKREYVIKEERPGKEREYQELYLEKDNLRQESKTEITGAEKNKLFPTNLAMVVNDFLVTNFPNVIDYSFTARVEKEFDEIAQGNEEWSKMIGRFYGNFHQKVENTENIERASVNTLRELGTDPKTGLTVYARLGKFGPIVQLGEATEEEKPQYASLRKGQYLESISLDEALELFKLPRTVGELEGKTITAAIGRFGPYLRHNNKFYSLGKNMDPLTVDEETAINLIKEKQEADAKKVIKLFEENAEVQVLQGRYGPYIKVGSKNVKIPKDREPESLTLHDCLTLAEQTPEKKGRKFAKKK
ncbi:type I DNA topoisomerase [Cesiribacter sp. SM1]|uniref:type I DNA topoisomerase n=1 Tax=Cesiribacter sp. SM1 TaxID=2861196 RepID=UPI001CD75793|nr:type I DNA topoisomerase [Cesiribacter sp. SM1]